MPLTTPDAEGIAKLRALANNPENFSPEGDAAIGSALEAGTEFLAESGTILRSLKDLLEADVTKPEAPGLK